MINIPLETEADENWSIMVTSSHQLQRCLLFLKPFSLLYYILMVCRGKRGAAAVMRRQPLEMCCRLHTWEQFDRVGVDWTPSETRPSSASGMFLPNVDCCSLLLNNRSGPRWPGGALGPSNTGSLCGFLLFFFFFNFFLFLVTTQPTQ